MDTDAHKCSELGQRLTRFLSVFICVHLWFTKKFLP